jgi:hypothetical protein
MYADLDMGTFLDRYHDFHDHCIEHQMPATVRVLQSGIGTISKSDIQVAIAAGKGMRLTDLTCVCANGVAPVACLLVFFLGGLR